MSTGIGLSLEKLTDKTDKSWLEIGVAALADGATSFGLGKIPGINKISSGKNSMSAVYKSGLTKLRNGTAKRMRMNVIKKGLISNSVDSGLSAVYADKAMKLSSYENNRLMRFLEGR